MADAELETAVARLLNDVETLRRSLRMYPHSHPALEPARARIRARALAVARDDVEGSLGLTPDKVFWNGQEIALAPHAPARRLAQFLFHLGIAAVRCRFPEAGEGLALLSSALATLQDPPGEGDRYRLAEAGPTLTGLDLVPIDLSGVQLVRSEEASGGSGSRLVLGELARRLSRDGAFLFAGKIREGELTPGLIVELLAAASDPEMLFDHVFLSLAEILASTPPQRRSPVLAEVREFFADLVRLLDPERKHLAVAVALRHLPVAGDSDSPPWVTAELLLDAVEFMLINQAPIPAAVHRALHRMAAPLAEQDPSLDERLAARARHLLAQIPPIAAQEAPPPPPPHESLAMEWQRSPWASELAAALAEDSIRLHVVRLLQETITLWPDETVADRAAVRLVEEFVSALDMRDLQTARHLAGMLAATRGKEARRVVYDVGVPATVHAFKTIDRALHPDVTAILVSLGEGALPTILASMAEEESLAMRKRLLEAAVRHGDKAKPYLYPLLDDPRWFVVRNAVFLLRHIGDRTRLPQYKDRLATAPPQVLEEMLKALVAGEDPEWFALLTQTIDSDDEERRLTAVEVAAHIPNADVVHALVERLERRMGRKLCDPFSIALIGALGRMRDPAALPILKRILALRQWFRPFPLGAARREAAVAVASLDDPDARGIARALAGSRDREVASAVRLALRRRHERQEAE
jgi:hypothetical protein